MIKVWIDLYNENMPHNAHILHCYFIGDERKVFCLILKKKERGGESESERFEEIMHKKVKFVEKSMM